MKFRRSIIQKRPGSFMTTIPTPALFNVPDPKAYNAIWEMNEKTGAFNVSFELKETTKE